MADELKARVFQMRTDEEFTRQLDELRRVEKDLPTRAEMLRRLVSTAFERMEARAAKKRS